MSIVVLMHLTLDGVMQAPGRADEDPRDGFPYGGWAWSRSDAINMLGSGPGGGSALLFGRRTYEDFFSVWPNRTDNPFTEVLDNSQKYVASTTLKEPLPWFNSTLLAGDIVEAVASLKQQGIDLLIMGSGELVRSLMGHNLIDRYILLIHPLILGQGRRLFAEGCAMETLQLVDTKTTPSGVIIATYQLRNSR